MNQIRNIIILTFLFSSCFCKGQDEKKSSKEIFKITDFEFEYDKSKWKLRVSQWGDAPVLLAKQSSIVFENYERIIQTNIKFDYFLIDEEHKNLSIEGLLMYFKIPNSENTILEKDTLGVENNFQSYKLGKIKLKYKNNNETAFDTYLISSRFLSSPFTTYQRHELEIYLLENILYVVDYSIVFNFLEYDLEQLKMMQEDEIKNNYFFNFLPKPGKQSIEDWYREQYVKDFSKYVEAIDNQERKYFEEVYSTFKPLAGIKNKSIKN